MSEFPIGVLTVSDRAHAGVYEDKGGPGIEAALAAILSVPWRPVRRLTPDEQPQIEAALRELADIEGCSLILTTGGTGPAPRDVTPDATRAIADRIMEGFGERMRQISLRFVPTAILSRQIAVIRKETLIINLPGQPKAIKETLEGFKDAAGTPIEVGIFAAVPYCVDLIGGPYLETHDEIIKAFRPKSAIRKDSA